jgi:hypothetical protein
VECHIVVPFRSRGVTSTASKTFTCWQAMFCRSVFPSHAALINVKLGAHERIGPVIDSARPALSVQISANGLASLFDLLLTCPYDLCYTGCG